MLAQRITNTCAVQDRAHESEILELRTINVKRQMLYMCTHIKMNVKPFVSLGGTLETQRGNSTSASNMRVHQTRTLAHCCHYYYYYHSTLIDIYIFTWLPSQIIHEICSTREGFNIYCPNNRRQTTHQNCTCVCVCAFRRYIECFYRFSTGLVNHLTNILLLCWYVIIDRLIV